MSYDRQAHMRLFLALSVEDAKEILGFPPGYNPTSEEVSKAYKRKAIENHPDRGGNPAKMVEVNVAKDILEGKRTRDLTKRYEETDPAAKAKAEAEQKLRKDIETIREQGQKASTALRTAHRRVNDGVLPGWRMDLKAYLNDEYADLVDMLHEAAEDGLQGKPGRDADQEWRKALRNTEQSWKKILEFTRILAADSARLASKFGSFKKRVQSVVDASLTFEEVQKLYAESAKTASAMKALRTTSGKLMSFMFTEETAVMDLDLAERYSKDGHGLIMAFDQDFEKHSDAALKDAEGVVKSAVKSVLAILKSYDVADGFSSDWKKWDVVIDFSSAAEVITKKGADKTAHRVVDRLRKQTSRG